MTDAFKNIRREGDRIIGDIEIEIPFNVDPHGAGKSIAEAGFAITARERILSGPKLQESVYTKCAECAERLYVGSWPFCASKANPTGHSPTRTHDALAHASEAVVLYEHPTKGVRWPGRNDVPMPERYAKDGFIRTEYRSVNDLKRIEKTHHVMSERLNYDRNGRAD